MRPLLLHLHLQRVVVGGGGVLNHVGEDHDVTFFESAEGGHGAGATNAQQAEYWALSYTYFARELGLDTVH